jgi:hypothetical protein
MKKRSVRGRRYIEELSRLNDVIGCVRVRLTFDNPELTGKRAVEKTPRKYSASRVLLRRF